MQLMYSTDRIIDGKTVTTFKRSFESANILLAEAGTNGFHGGDSGHGCRTYIRITNEGGTAIIPKVITDADGSETGIEIILGGDTELQTIIQALKFIVKVLKAQSNHYESGNP